MTSLHVLECKLADLPVEVAKLSMNKEKSPFSKAKMQKVQPYLRHRTEFFKYYSPKLVSIGPIHRHRDDGKINLEQGEEYKLMWAWTYLEGMGTDTAKQLLQKVSNELGTLKGLYAEYAIQGSFNDAELAWMFFIDGCAVLHFMDKADIENPGALKIKVDQLVMVLQDLLLLENQIPFEVLKLLSNDDDAKLESYINNFFKIHLLIPHQVDKTHKLEVKPEVRITVDQPPTHLLDLLRSAILHPYGHGNNQTWLTRLMDLLHKAFFHVDDHECTLDEQVKKNNQAWPTHRNVKELKASGIGIQTRKNTSLTEISFYGGKLYIPQLIVDSFTATTFLNMIAYEMCPDFENKYEIRSYVLFLNSLIDHLDDVKELRNAGVLHNLLGSDEDVAKVFDTISADLVLDVGTYMEVRYAIEKHYADKCKTRIAEAYHKYFSSPWAIIGLLATFIGTFLTVNQTWMAILEFHLEKFYCKAA